MCDVGTALKMGGAIMSKMGEKRDQEQHYQNTYAASVNSMNSQGDQANLKFEEENRTALEEAYDLALENRANQASFLVQAVENGVTGISVNEGFFALVNKGGRSRNRAEQEVRSRKAAHNQHLLALQSQAASRINSAAPTTSSGDVLMAGASAGIQGAQEGGHLKNLKIG